MPSTTSNNISKA